MAEYILACDEAWTGSTCAGTLSSLDVSDSLGVAAPFDWALVDPAELGSLFALGFGSVIPIWALAWGLSRLFDVVNKS